MLVVASCTDGYNGVANEHAAIKASAHTKSNKTCSILYSERNGVAEWIATHKNGNRNKHKEGHVKPLPAVTLLAYM
eukprot:671263-Amphidinium_carterae.1